MEAAGENGADKVSIMKSALKLRFFRVLDRTEWELIADEAFSGRSSTVFNSIIKNGAHVFCFVWRLC